MVFIVTAVFWYMAMIWALSVGLPDAERLVSESPTAYASPAASNGTWGGKLLVIAGTGGILTSRNASLNGRKRAIAKANHHAGPPNQEI